MVSHFGYLRNFACAATRERVQWCQQHPETNLSLSVDMPADGIRAASWRERRLRYVAVFWAALQTSHCLTVCS
jgi:hypothetical protein